MLGIVFFPELLSRLGGTDNWHTVVVAERDGTKAGQLAQCGDIHCFWREVQCFQIRAISQWGDIERFWAVGEVELL